MPNCVLAPPRTSVRPLVISLFITVAFMFLEIAGGILSGSLALISDAGHMFTDAGALAFSLLAVWLARRPADQKRTFGYYRIEILAALSNGAFLWIMVFFIFREAISRLMAPGEINVKGMILFGLLGLAVNAANIAILHRSQKENINIRAAFLHVVGDAMGSVGVVVAGVIILFTGWTAADSIAGMLIGLLILYSSWGLIKDAVHILLEGSPSHIETQEIRQGILGVPGVKDIHDLHIWTLTPRMILLTAHVVIDGDEAEADSLRRRVRDLIAREFCIEHITLQIENVPDGDEGRKDAGNAKANFLHHNDHHH